ncbi:AfuA ABC-type Fe3+ transport system, periplasmic component [Burkholderiaceae bacterium]
MKQTLFGSILIACVLQGLTPAAAQTNEYGSPELIKAATKEGKLVLYTTMDKENTMRAIGLFNKRFPGIDVQVLRMPGGQLVTRVQAEMAAGKLAADIVSFSDQAQVDSVQTALADYAPPNASGFPAPNAAKKAWPLTMAAWCIGYNTELVKNPPKSWAELTDAQYKGKLGEVTILTGGTGWVRSMFERETLGEGYWAALAANKPKIFPSGVPLSDALLRGEVSVAAIITNQILPRTKEGAPITCNFAKEGIPVIELPISLVKNAKAPNAATLFMNWSLSKEGQSIVVNDWKMFSALSGTPSPEGFDPSVHKIWRADPAKTAANRETWTKEWTQLFNWR